MCLMCEFYIGSCSNEECWERAKGEERYTGRSGYKMFLWKGYSEPCEHIKAEHGPECDILNPELRDCNCEPSQEGWLYY